MAGNPFYANARAKSAENYLLGADRFNRMLQADSAEDALKILREVNFGEGANAESALEFEALLRAEREKLNRFVREVSPSRAFRRFFLAESDYHNAEALIKAKHLKISAEPLLTAGGDIDPARMEEKIMRTIMRPFRLRWFPRCCTATMRLSTVRRRARGSETR